MQQRNVSHKDEAGVERAEAAVLPSWMHWRERDTVFNDGPADFTLAPSTYPCYIRHKNIKSMDNVQFRSGRCQQLISIFEHPQKYNPMSTYINFTCSFQRSTFKATPAECLSIIPCLQLISAHKWVMIGLTSTLTPSSVLKAQDISTLWGRHHQVRDSDVRTGTSLWLKIRTIGSSPSLVIHPQTQSEGSSCPLRLDFPIYHCLKESRI